MSVKGKNHISMMLALSRSILESAEHLTAQKDIALLKSDTITGLQTLEESLSFFKAYTSMKATQLLKACIEHDVYLSDREFHIILQHWQSSISETISSLWTMEALKCPVCDSAGAPAYMASLYQNTDEGIKTSLTRFWLQCSACRNYYAVKNAPYPVTEDISAIEQSYAYTRMAEAAEKYVQEGFLLYVGDNRKCLSDLLSYDSYIFHSCTLRQLEKAQDNSMCRGQYHALFLDNLLLAGDIEAVLKNALDYLDNHGILWFEIPDMELAFQKLCEEGISLSFYSGSDVFLHPLGIEELRNRLGFHIISYRRVNEGDMFEFIVGKESGNDE